MSDRAKVDPYFDRRNEHPRIRFGMMTRVRGTGPLVFWSGSKGWIATREWLQLFDSLSHAKDSLRRLQQPRKLWTHKPLFTAHATILPEYLLKLPLEQLETAWLDPAVTFGNQYWRIAMVCPECHSPHVKAIFHSEKDLQEVSCEVCLRRIGCSAHPSALNEHRRWCAFQDAIEIWNALHHLLKQG